MAGHFVYVLECSDGTLYTGYAVDVARRIAAHNSGRGAKYTAGRAPVRLMFVQELPTKKEALRRESEIKGMPRDKKLELLEKRQGRKSSR